MLKNQGGLADAIEHCKKAIQTNPQWDEPRQLQVRQHCQLRTDSHTSAGSNVQEAGQWPRGRPVIIYFAYI